MVKKKKTKATKKAAKTKVKPKLKKKIELLKTNTVKSYVKEKIKLKIAKDSVELFSKEMNNQGEKILKKAGKFSKEEEFKTIMLQHMIKALEEQFGEKELSLNEIYEKIENLSAVEIGKLIKKIKEHIQELQA